MKLKYIRSFFNEDKRVTKVYLTAIQTELGEKNYKSTSKKKSKLVKYPLLQGDNNAHLT